MGEMNNLETFVTDREMVEAMHISLLQDLGLEDISVRRYTLSERPICINAKYTCRYNSWEITVMYKTSKENPAGTLAISSLESLIYGDVYEVNIELIDSNSYLKKLCHIKNIIDGDPRVYINNMIELISETEHSFRSYGFKVRGILTPELIDSKGMLSCELDGTTLHVSLSFNKFGEICFCISNTLNWRNETQNEKNIKGILIPINDYQFDSILNFVENDILHKKLTNCAFYKEFAENYSWHK